VLELCAAKTGRKLDLRILPEAEAIQWHIDHETLPKEQESFLTGWATMHRAWAKGECDYVDPLLEKLIKRRPKGIEELQDELFKEDLKVDTNDFVGI